MHTQNSTRRLNTLSTKAEAGSLIPKSPRGLRNEPLRLACPLSARYSAPLESATMLSGRVVASTPRGSDHVAEKGSEGDEVVELQQELNGLGFELEEDGIFGTQTHNAVITLQTIFGYDVDGIAGPATQADPQAVGIRLEPGRGSARPSSTVRARLTASPLDAHTAR